MTDAELKELKKGITLTASYYGRELKPEVIAMMAEDLSNLPFAKVSQAYLTYRRDPKNRTMPLPAQIRAIVDPQPTPEAEGREAVERIKLAIAKFGWPQGEAARAFIGEVGWRIVEGMGGWMRVCESDFIHNPGLIAQARNRAEDLVRYEDHFSSNVVALPTSRTDQALIEDRKFEAVKQFKEHQAQKDREVKFDIPSDEDRARMIQALLSKKSMENV